MYKKTSAYEKQLFALSKHQLMKSYFHFHIFKIVSLLVVTAFNSLKLWLLGRINITNKSCFFSNVVNITLIAELVLVQKSYG